MQIKAHSYDISVIDDAVNLEGDKHVEIQLWCFDQNSNPCLLRVRDFPAICKLELPITTDRSGNVIHWDISSVDELLEEMLNYMTKKEMEPFDKSSFTSFTRLYYYAGGKKYPYIVMTFKTIKDMRSASRLFKTFYSRNFGKLSLIFRETGIDIYNKMFSMKNLGPTERFECSAIEIMTDDEERITKPGPPHRPFREYEIDWRSMSKLPGDMWLTYPEILSWDIEAYSHRPKAFPQKNDMYDRVFSISATFQEHMKPETRKDYVVIIGPSEPQENVITYNVETEEQVIAKFFELIELEDPDVFIGYNIFGFDYAYLDARIKGVGKEWPNIGRLLEQKCDIKSIKWKSGAYGHNNINYIKAAGRISVDMYPYLKRDYKLPMYNLNAVGHYFLNENKTDLKANEMFEIHKQVSDSMTEIMSLGGEDNVIDAMNNIKTLNLDNKSKENIEKAIRGNTLIVKYNVQDSVLVLKLFEKLNVWISLIELSAVVRVTPMEFFTRGQQVRCIAQLYHAASHRNIVLTTRDHDYIYFNGGKVEDPRAGFWKLVICFDFTSLYPSIMIAYNICFTTLIRDHGHMEPEKYHPFSIEQEEPIDAKPPADDNFDYGDYFKNSDTQKEKSNVKTVKRHYDFGFVTKEVQRGLLPEILDNLLSQRKKAKKAMKKANTKLELIDENIFVPHRENSSLEVSDLNETGKRLIDEMLNVKDGKITDLLPLINDKFFGHKVQEAMFNSRQLGLKVSSNSMYGFLGAQVFGKFSLIEGSMAVTSRGRELITEAALFFEKHYGAITVYGDTDSTMVAVPSLNDDPTKAWDMAETMEDHINGNDNRDEGIFPEPLFLGLEKIMQGLFMKKKKYAYTTFDRKGKIIKEKNSDRDELNVKGIILARRDNCEWLRTSYEDCIRGIFDGKNIFDIYEQIIQNIVDVIELKFDITKELSIIRAMGSNYKSKTYFLSIFSDLMKSLSRPVAPSERFRYVIVNDHQKRDKVGYRMRTDEMFKEQWSEAGINYGEMVPEGYKPVDGLYPPEEIDSCYYITNVLKEPIDQLFEFGFARVIDKYNDVIYKPVYKPRLKPVNMTRPVAMIELLIRDRQHLIEKEGAKHLLPVLKALPDWFRNCKK